MADLAYKPPAYLDQRVRMPSPDYLLDFYLGVKRETDTWEVPVERRGWRASSLGNCPRAQTLQRRGIDGLRSFDAKTLRTFAWGDMIHDFVRGVFFDLGLAVVQEPTFIDPDRSVSGHVDLIWNPAGGAGNPVVAKRLGDVLRRMYDDGTGAAYADDIRQGAAFDPDSADYVPDVNLGLELKSLHSNAIKRVFKEGAYEHHKAQVGSYKLMAQTTPPFIVDGIGLFDPRTVERWFITYVGKDSVGLLTFECEDSWVDDAASTLDLLNAHWDKALLPACTCQGWKVDYCDYNEGDTCCGRNLKGQVSKAIRQWDATGLVERGR